VPDVRRERLGSGRPAPDWIAMKGSQKPKKGQKKPAQKTIKERRAEKKLSSDPRRYDAP
jgi:hypothetical protein